MKRLLFAILLTICAKAVCAQDGFTHFFAKSGPVYRDAWTVSAGLDFASKYHSSYELAFAYYYRNTHRYESYLIGMHFKPVLLRNKNSAFKFRLGAFAGTDMDRFIAAPSLGLEWLLSLSGKVDFVLSNGNGYYFFADALSRWRIAGEAGFRFSF